MKKYTLELVVFLSGATVMVFELVGSRVLGPYVGTSIFVWTSLIGIILLSLALGNFIGGRIADQFKSANFLSFFILLGAFFISATGYFKEDVLNLAIRHFSGIKLPALFSTILLFAPAGILLGTVAPYATRLRISVLEKSGRTVGTLYALSTTGSIIGTFAAGFLLIPTFSTSHLIFLLSLILTFTAGILFKGPKKYRLWFVFLFLLIMNLYGIWGEKPTSGTFIFDGNTKYSRVKIFDAINPWQGNDSVRIMKINNEYAAASFKHKEGLVFGIMQYYSKDSLFTAHIENALMLGGAACIFPQHFLKKHPQATIDVVEIDPDLTDLAKKYFGLQEDARLQMYHEDARTFINANKKQYDAFYGDAYKSTYSVPYQLTTKEFMEKTYKLLRSDGVAFFNIISNLNPKKNIFFRSQLKTIQSVFPQVLVLAVADPENKEMLQNMLIIARKTTNPELLSTLSLRAPDVYKHLIKEAIPTEDAYLLTDDYAPAEFLVNKLL